MSLLSTMYTLLERLVRIVSRIQIEKEKIWSKEPASFRKHRSCTEQVLVLTIHVEAEFQNNIKASKKSICWKNKQNKTLRKTQKLVDWRMNCHRLERIDQNMTFESLTDQYSKLKRRRKR